MKPLRLAGPGQRRLLHHRWRPKHLRPVSAVSPVTLAQKFEDYKRSVGLVEEAAPTPAHSTSTSASAPPTSGKLPSKDFPRPFLPDRFHATRIHPSPDDMGEPPTSPIYRQPRPRRQREALSHQPFNQPVARFRRLLRSPSRSSHRTDPLWSLFRIRCRGKNSPQLTAAEWRQWVTMLTDAVAQTSPDIPVDTCPADSIFTLDEEAVGTRNIITWPADRLRFTLDHWIGTSPSLWSAWLAHYLTENPALESSTLDNAPLFMPSNWKDPPPEASLRQLDGEGGTLNASRFIKGSTGSPIERQFDDQDFVVLVKAYLILDEPRWASWALAIARRWKIFDPFPGDLYLALFKGFRRIGDGYGSLAAWYHHYPTTPTNTTGPTTAPTAFTNMFTPAPPDLTEHPTLSVATAFIEALALSAIYSPTHPAAAPTTTIVATSEVDHDQSEYPGSPLAIELESIDFSAQPYVAVAQAWLNRTTHSGMVAEAEQRLQDLETQYDWAFPTSTYIALAQGYWVEGQFEAVQACYTRCLKPQETTWTTMERQAIIQLIARTEGMELMDQPWIDRYFSESALWTDLPPVQSTIEVLIAAFSQSSQPQQALQLFDLHSSRSDPSTVESTGGVFEWSHKTMWAIAQALLDTSRPSRARDLVDERLAQHPRLTITDYNALIPLHAALADPPAPAPAFLLYRQLCQSHLRPTVATFEALLQVCITHWDHPSTRLVVGPKLPREIRAAGLTYTVRLYNRWLEYLLLGPKGTDHLDEAMEVLETMLTSNQPYAQPDHTTYELIVRCLCQQGMYRDAENFFPLMRQNYIEPSTELVQLVAQQHGREELD
ncbi:hypothetical protein H4R33_005175 [Dimargaris cristalligena]|nr:hypothetical protein H4R33_005175 [Dimargaris cristalligena]